jgi:hypothetical protein
LTSRFD